jgi:hypothetical protein
LKNGAAGRLSPKFKIISSRVNINSVKISLKNAQKKKVKIVDKIWETDK